MRRLRDSARRRGSRRDGGFTMLEVMIALLIASVGLLGTLAVQQTVLLMVGHARDAQMANHLAAEAFETINSRLVSAGPPLRDQICPLIPGATCPPSSTAPTIVGTAQRCACVTSGGAQTVITCPGAPPATALEMASAGCTGASRFFLQTVIVSPGTGLPYRISVWVVYSSDSDHTKQVRLDAQKWKNNW